MDKIEAWKAHILRAVHQDVAKDGILHSMSRTTSPHHHGLGDEIFTYEFWEERSLLARNSCDY